MTWENGGLSQNKKHGFRKGLFWELKVPVFWALWGRVGQMLSLNLFPVISNYDLNFGWCFPSEKGSRLARDWQVFRMLTSIGSWLWSTGRIDFRCRPFRIRSIALMKNFQKELLSISKSISKVAAKLETLANDIDGQSMEEKPVMISSSSEAIVKETT